MKKGGVQHRVIEGNTRYGDPPFTTLHVNGYVIADQPFQRLVVRAQKVGP